MGYPIRVLLAAILSDLFFTVWLRALRIPVSPEVWIALAIIPFICLTVLGVLEILHRRAMRCYIASLQVDLQETIEHVVPATEVEDTLLNAVFHYACEFGYRVPKALRTLVTRAHDDPGELYVRLNVEKGFHLPAERTERIAAMSGALAHAAACDRLYSI